MLQYRYNLDPDGMKSDDDIWKSLEIAQLKNLISQLPSRLGECTVIKHEIYTGNTFKLHSKVKSFKMVFFIYTVNTLMYLSNLRFQRI